MTQKLFLTSALAMGVIAPAMAEPERVDTFPNAANNEFMQENKVYTNAATADNMDSVYEGTVNAVAEYDIIDYIVNAGQYLPADSETVITCPAGSFCPGIDGNVQYNQTTPQGIQTCPTGYASSAAGASSDTECYRQCSGNVTIEHATGVTGNDYYGNGVDTCAPTECEHGWHVKSATPKFEPITSDLYGGISNTGEFKEYDWNGNNPERGVSFYGLDINDHNSFGLYYESKGWKLRGHGRCSTKTGARTGGMYNYVFSTEISVPDETGQTGAKYCYCQLDGYTVRTDGNWQEWQGLTSSYFTFGEEYDDETKCASSCSLGCAVKMVSMYFPDFRNKMIDSIIPTLASCEANTITINWNGTTQEAINANNAGSTTYGSDVRTPVSATPVKGKTFKGWRFSKPEQTNLP